MNDLLSVIVPVYNSEKYLDECITSILNQTYRNLECLLIDDGSTDRSGEICDKYAVKDSRVRVFHIPNGGVCNARNYGLERINGRFLAFADNDDGMEPEMYSELIKVIEEKNVDVAICNFMNCGEIFKVLDSRGVEKI